MLCGLALYAVASALALVVNTFDGLLAAQALAALGASAGSVVTQTFLRDRFSGAELARVFSIVGMTLAASPAGRVVRRRRRGPGLGLPRRGAFCLLMLALGLLGWTAAALPETRPAGLPPAPLPPGVRGDGPRPGNLAQRLAGGRVQHRAVQPSYALGPFLFERLHAGARG